MPVTKKVTVLTAFAAALCALAASQAASQSFYETITAVARTESPEPDRAATRGSAAAMGSFETQVVPTVPPEPPAKAGRPEMLVRKGNHQFKAVVDPDAERWPNSEVQIARARCRHILKSISAEVTPMEPLKKGPCGEPAPVRLMSIGSKPKVAVDPPAVLNCDMVVAMHDWLVKDLQPLARKHLKTQIVKIETMSSYSCRNAYGRRDTRLSQHGLANAMDIRGFVTAKTDRARLAAHWGPTQRDIRWAQRKQMEKRRRETELAERAKTAPAQAAAGAQPAPQAQPSPEPSLASTAQPADSARGHVLAIRPSFLDGVAALVGKGREMLAEKPAENAFSLAPSRLGGPAIGEAREQIENQDDGPHWPVILASETVDTSKAATPRARFLREAHQRACGRFGTVLGPEANNAHKNHFHVDLADRQLGNYCR